MKFVLGTKCLAEWQVNRIIITDGKSQKYKIVIGCFYRPGQSLQMVISRGFYLSKSMAIGFLQTPFLPPYSPDLNPIENKWANLKQHRKYNLDISLDQLIISYG